MVLLRSKTLFTGRFVAGLQGRTRAVANAEVLVYTAALAASGLSVVATETSVYSGVARVQPIRSTSNPQTPGSEASVQLVRVQLPLDATTVYTPGMYVRLTACTLLPALVGLTGVVKDVLDAPNAVERTLLAEFDTATQVTSGG